MGEIIGSQSGPRASRGIPDRNQKRPAVDRAGVDCSDADELSPGNCRDDAHLITISDWCRLTFQEPDVLAVNVDVHETTDLTKFVMKAIMEARKIGLQRSENLAHRARLQRHF